MLARKRDGGGKEACGSNGEKHCHLCDVLWLFDVDAEILSWRNVSCRCTSRELDIDRTTSVRISVIRPLSRFLFTTLFKSAT